MNPFRALDIEKGLLRVDISSTFEASFKALSSQKGSLYGATIVMRLIKLIDFRNLSQVALDEVKNSFYTIDDVLFVGNIIEHERNVHDQLITQASAIYSFYILGDLETARNLVPGLILLIKRVTNDYQKTIGAEVLIPFYLNKLIEMTLLTRTSLISKLINTYTKILNEKIKSGTKTLLFSLEGFEGSPYFYDLLEEAKKVYTLFDNVELLAFLANYNVEGAYDKLYEEYERTKTFQTKAFMHGEIFEIAWQFHLIMYSGVLGENALKNLALKAMPYIDEAGFNNRDGVSISKYFVMKDADTTAMVYKLLYMCGRKVPLSVFSPYLQEYKGKNFFGSYKNEIRPSLGTMADILDALSYSDKKDISFYGYLRIIHNNISYAVRHEDRDIDKWHSSKLYFYANALVGYVNILKKVEQNELNFSFYTSLVSVRENLAERLMLALENDSRLTCEEIGWAIFSLNYYFQNIKIIYDFKNARSFLGKKGKELEACFRETYGSNPANLERMWIVKVAYNPINVVSTLINTAIAVSTAYTEPDHELLP